MKRWREDLRVYLRERKKYLASRRRRYIESGGQDHFLLPDAQDIQLGWFRKKDQGDCGKTGCGVCHGLKRLRRELHRHEIISNVRFREQLAEL